MFNWAKKLTPYLDQPLVEVQTYLNILRETYRTKDIIKREEVLNKFRLFPGYPFLSIGSFSQHMRYAYRYLREAKKNSPPKIPFLATPKSASSFINVILCNMFSVRPTILSHEHHNPVTSWIKAFATYGGITHDHYYPSRYNLDLLHTAGITKCIIHTRDPMDTLISQAFHWIDTHPNPRIQPQSNEAGRILLAREYLDQEIESLLKHHATWLQLWRHEATSGRMTILETHYEDMKVNQVAFFQRILEFIGMPFDNYKLENVLKKFSPKKSSNNYNFRKALVNEWKHVLTPHLIDRANQLIKIEFSK